MDKAVKVLAQRSQRVELAGIEVDIYAPSVYRVQEVIEAALELPEAFAALRSTEFGTAVNESDDGKTIAALKECVVKLIGKSAVALRLICADKSGNVSEELESDDFWYKTVSLSEIVALIDVFTELMDVESVLKKVALLTGGTRQISRGLTSSLSPAKPSAGASTT